MANGSRLNYFCEYCFAFLKAYCDNNYISQCLQPMDKKIKYIKKLKNQLNWKLFVLKCEFI